MKSRQCFSCKNPMDDTEVNLPEMGANIWVCEACFIFYQKVVEKWRGKK